MKPWKNMYAIKENQTPFIPVLSDEGFPAVELIPKLRDWRRFRGRGLRTKFISFRGLLIVTELMAYKLNLHFFQSGNHSVFQNITGRLAFKDLLN